MFSKYFEHLIKKRHYAVLNKGEVDSSNYYLKRYGLNKVDYWSSSRKFQPHAIYSYIGAKRDMKFNVWKVKRRIGLRKYWRVYNK